jgi:hypothetical protein
MLLPRFGDTRPSGRAARTPAIGRRIAALPMVAPGSTHHDLASKSMVNAFHGLRSVARDNPSKSRKELRYESFFEFRGMELGEVLCCVGRHCRRHGCCAGDSQRLLPPGIASEQTR